MMAVLVESKVGSLLSMKMYYSGTVLYSMLCKDLGHDVKIKISFIVILLYNSYSERFSRCIGNPDRNDFVSSNCQVIK